MAYQQPPAVEPPPVESIRRDMVRYGITDLKSVAGIGVVVAGLVGVTVLSIVESGINWTVGAHGGNGGWPGGRGGAAWPTDTEQCPVPLARGRGILLVFTELHPVKHYRR